LETSDSMCVCWHGGKLPKRKTFLKEEKLDVSKHKHEVYIRNLSQDSYSGVFSINVNRQGFEKFLGTLEKLSQKRIEVTGNYVLKEIDNG